jgi:hypothetical protein
LKQGTIGGTIIAQQAFSLPGNVTSPDFVNVNFNPYPGIAVTPGSTYVLDLIVQGPNTVRWYDMTPAGYSGGTAITNGSPDTSVDYLFKTYGFGNTITMNILWNTVSSNITLASKTQPIPAVDAPIIMRFNLTTPIAVTPGDPYVIELIQTPESAGWYIVSPTGGYSEGAAITNGKPNSHADYLFATYGASYALTVSIRSGTIGGPLIGSTVATIPLTAYALIHVDFPGTIPLAPGTQYVIELNETVQSMRWYIVQPAGAYLGGSAITNGVAIPNADYIFQTYAPAGLTPTTLSISFAPTTLNMTTPSGTGTITVTLTPSIAGEPIALYYTTNPAGNWTTITTGHTDPTGKFAVGWKPPQTGTYYFRADFTGDINYAGSTTTSAPNAMTVVPEFPQNLITLITALALSLVQITFIRKMKRTTG